MCVSQDLLKHTSEDHPDHPFLLDAQRDIKRLAERINKGRRSAEEVERETRVMQEIEAHIEGVEHVRLGAVWSCLTLDILVVVSVLYSLCCRVCVRWSFSRRKCVFLPMVTSVCVCVCVRS